MSKYKISKVFIFFVPSQIHKLYNFESCRRKLLPKDYPYSQHSIIYHWKYTYILWTCVIIMNSATHGPQQPAKSVDIIVFLYEYGFVWVVNSVGQKIKINSFSFGCRQFFFFQYKKLCITCQKITQYFLPCHLILPKTIQYFR